jgi:hypothetical protein
MAASAQSCRSIGWPYVAACRIQRPVLNRKAMVDRPDAGIVTNGHNVSHTILDVFPLSYQNTQNDPINAKKLSQLTAPLGYTAMRRVKKNEPTTTMQKHKISTTLRCSSPKQTNGLPHSIS